RGTVLGLPDHALDSSRLTSPDRSPLSPNPVTTDDKPARRGAHCLFMLAVALLGITRIAPAQQSVQEALPLDWQEAAPGVWRADAGTPEDVSLLGAAAVQPRRDALARLPSVEFPLPRPQIRAVRVDGKLYLRFPLGADEQLYGLGLNFKRVQQRGVVK